MSTLVKDPAITDGWIRAQAHNLDMVVDRMVKKGLVNDQEEGQALATEYRRYMTIVAEHPGQIFAPSDQVDEVWHAHLLFTADYAAFCDAVVGTFVHHRPATDRGLMQPCYHQTIHALHARFGDDLNGVYWDLSLLGVPVDAHAKRSLSAMCGCGTGSCGDHHTV
jgi:hypothetical protein